MDFESGLSGIFTRQVNRLQVLDFGVLTEEIEQAVMDILRMDYTRDDGHVMFTSHAWLRMFEIHSLLIKELMLDFFNTCRFTDAELGLDIPGDNFTWVAPGPERQLDVEVGAAQVDLDFAEEGALAVPTPA
uniref:Uncharacterized protein n=1 Tax=Tanacetum cinerariifolium TaxID=118510 RepID=A0A699GXQ0_TANCI|nr:hypothetical protein [Tanacetum cinerariifolium]